MRVNRWKLAKDVKEKYKPIVQEFLTKMENIKSEEIEDMNGDEFTLELSDTKLNPNTLLELMREFGYGNEEFDNNGWELDYWINIRKSGRYDSTSERLCIHGCGMTFELSLSVSEFM